MIREIASWEVLTQKEMTTETEKRIKRGSPNMLDTQQAQVTPNYSLGFQEHHKQHFIFKYNPEYEIKLSQAV